MLSAPTHPRPSAQRSGTSDASPAATRAAQSRFSLAVCFRTTAGGPTAPPSMIGPPSPWPNDRGSAGCTRCPSQCRRVWSNPELSILWGESPSVGSARGRGFRRGSESLLSSPRADNTFSPLHRSRPGAGCREGARPVTRPPEVIPCGLGARAQGRGGSGSPTPVPPVTCTASCAGLSPQARERV